MKAYVKKEKDLIISKGVVEVTVDGTIIFNVVSSCVVAYILLTSVICKIETVTGTKYTIRYVSSYNYIKLTLCK